MSKFIPQGMGWIPDLPDARDFSYRHQAIHSLLERLRRPSFSELPDQVDLRGDEDGEYFTLPENQGSLNCSSACAVISLLEYFQRRIRGHTFEGSKLFLYKATRNRLQKRLPATGDTGADLRTTLKVLVQFGVPPEERWPFEIDKFDDEPAQFLYKLAKPFPELRYFRLDEQNCSGSTTWDLVQSFLAAGFPLAFGFPVPTSLNADSNVPYRPEFDGIRGGQAVLAVGYKYNHFGSGQHALLIRSSWGSEWGNDGNGWLPISFLRQQLARDFWTLISEDWLDSQELSRPSILDSLVVSPAAVKPIISSADRL